MSRILVVDDEKPIADIICFNLKKEGYEVDVAYDGEEALEKTKTCKPDLIILDVMLPRLDGLQVCRQVRAESDVPILMLTARDNEIDKVTGLDIGADDYVTKPFSPRELMARVRALLRRTGRGAGGSNRIVSGDLVIDPRAYEVYRGGERIELTLREYELLFYLASNAGRVFSREHLLEEVWGYDFYGDIRTVDVTVRRLREKIERDPSHPEYIITKRGVGYVFNYR